MRCFTISIFNRTSHNITQEDNTLPFQSQEELSELDLIPLRLLHIEEGLDGSYVEVAGGQGGPEGGRGEGCDGTPVQLHQRVSWWWDGACAMRCWN